MLSFPPPTRKQLRTNLVPPAPAIPSPPELVFSQSSRVTAAALSLLLLPAPVDPLHHLPHPGSGSLLDLPALPGMMTH